MRVTGARNRTTTNSSIPLRPSPTPKQQQLHNNNYTTPNNNNYTTTTYKQHNNKTTNPSTTTTTPQVFKTPEVCRVYIGSFNATPSGAPAPPDAAKNPECAALFERERAALLDDLAEIPARSCDRKGARARAF